MKRSCRVGIIFAVACVGAAAVWLTVRGPSAQHSTREPARPDANALAHTFEESYTAYCAKDYPMDDGRWVGWFHARVLDSLLARYEQTENAMYLERFQSIADQMLEARDGNVWPTEAYPNEGIGPMTMPVITAMAAWPLARYAAIVRADLDILHEVDHATAERYAESAVVALAAHDNLWRTAGAYGWYVAPAGTFFAKRRTALPINRQLALARAHIGCWLATGKAMHRDRAERLFRWFKVQCRPTPGSLLWPYEPGYRTSSIEDDGLPDLQAIGKRWGEDPPHADLSMDCLYWGYVTGCGITERDLHRASPWIVIGPGVRGGVLRGTLWDPDTVARCAAFLETVTDPIRRLNLAAAILDEMVAR